MSSKHIPVPVRWRDALIRSRGRRANERSIRVNREAHLRMILADDVLHISTYRTHIRYGARTGTTSMQHRHTTRVSRRHSPRTSASTSHVRDPISYVVLDQVVDLLNEVSLQTLPMITSSAHLWDRCPCSGYYQ